MGYTITLGHTTLGRTALVEWSAQRRDLYLPRDTHNHQSQQASGLWDGQFPILLHSIICQSFWRGPTPYCRETHISLLTHKLYHLCFRHCLFTNIYSCCYIFISHLFKKDYCLTLYCCRLIWRDRCTSNNWILLELYQYQLRCFFPWLWFVLVVSILFPFVDFLVSIMSPVVFMPSHQ